MTATASRPAHGSVVRIEVHRNLAAADARARRLLQDARAIGVELAGARVARVYLLEGKLNESQIERIRRDLLTDAVLESSLIGASPDAGPDSSVVIEVHPLPGVMDPAAQSVASAIETLVAVPCQVSTAWRYELEGIDPAGARSLAERLLANTVVHAIHEGAHWPDELPKGHERQAEVREIPLTSLDDDALTKLSREAHLFLSLDEMRAIQTEYRRLGREPREIELETLAQTWSEHCVHKTLKSTVSYRGPGASLGSSPNHNDIDWAERPGVTVQDDGTILIDNLLKSTVAAATHELIADGLDWTLSVFVDNAGVIAFDDDTAICVKVETHNHPSALEPYGGAATGIGGCIRDIIGTGLAAKPIANTDVFCVAYPEGFTTEGTEDTEKSKNATGSTPSAKPTQQARSSPSAPSAVNPLPPGCLHPRRILTNVVAGVRDYGNRMGIPTLNGAVEFDNRYVGNPLVFAGCVGVMPRDRVAGDPQSGDLIVALGGRTGRDGIHGATFSSAELTDTHADEFSHAVQIGNAIEEKRVLDAILRARDADTTPLFSAITDCGAGGFSSAVGEMGEKLGAEVHLDRAPLKYAGLTSTEIWISEAQERMVLAVPEANLPALQEICDEEHVELAVLGHFGTPNQELILYDHDIEVGRMPMTLLHEGIPMPTREATWNGCRGLSESSSEGHVGGPKPQTPALRDALLILLAHPSIASKHWIIRQYDHEVQGNAILKPLVGPLGRGPADASVIEPVPGSGRGLAIANGLGVDRRVDRLSEPMFFECHPAPASPIAITTHRFGEPIYTDPYQMALAAIDECVRNLVCVGADPARIAILDNFCWPSCNKPEHMGALVRACIGCYDGAKAYRTPFISGKDSLNNQLTIPATDGKPPRTIEIPYTLLISGVGIVPDVNKCVTMDAKRPGSKLVVVGTPDDRLGASIYAQLFGIPDDADAGHPPVDLQRGPLAAKAVAKLIREGLALSVHDISDGGLLVALSEMLIAGSSDEHPLGAHISDPATIWSEAMRFSECSSTYLLEVAIDTDTDQDPWAAFQAVIAADAEWTCIGEIIADDVLIIGRDASATEIEVEDLAEAWRSPLDW